MNFLISWSGGKDSCYAMMKAVQAGNTPKVLLNMMNENGKVSRSHGISLSILQQQAKQMNLPLRTVPASWTDYEQQFISTLQDLKKEFSLEAAVFGDIDLQAHKEWEEKVCSHSGLYALLPLWQQNRLQLVQDMITNGLVTMIVSCNTKMGEKYLGKILTFDLALELIKLGIDPCGENGEFHTLVIDCPLFEAPITIPEYKTATYESYCFVVWS